MKEKPETYYQSIKRRDPAARNNFQIFFLYPSVRAMRRYRFAHFLWKHHFKFLAEAIMVVAKKRTGIEIHPAATIGKNFFIDHGSGVVIGETAVIGDNCTLFHGVTLGGISMKKGQRHPQLGNNVLCGTASVLLGNITIGDNVSIGPNEVVRVDVPANSIFVHGEIVPKAKKEN